MHNIYIYKYLYVYIHTSVYYAWSVIAYYPWLLLVQIKLNIVQKVHHFFPRLAPGAPMQL